MLEFLDYFLLETLLQKREIMKNKIFIISLLSTLPLLIFAQNNKDYILTINQDTLFGNIKNNLDWESITFVHQKKKVFFHAGTIQYFSIFRNGEYLRYKSIKDTNGTNLFVQILNEGKIKLYKAAEQYHRFAKFNHFERMYYVGPSEEDLVAMNELDYSIFIKNIAKEFPDLAPELKLLSFENLPKLVAMYNEL